MQATLSIRRYALSAAIAVVITAGLLLVMHYAIHNQSVDIALVKPLPTVQLLPLIPDEEPTGRPPPVEKPDPPEQRPDVPKQIPQGIGTGFIEIVPPTAGKPGRAGFADPLPEGDYLPVMTVPPEYPSRMLSRGVEGWVVVEFSVDELGRVQAPRVVAAQPGSGFNASALRAVSRYKYSPRVLDGKAVRVDGVRQRIVFNMGV